MLVCMCTYMYFSDYLHMSEQGGVGRRSWTYMHMQHAFTRCNLGRFLFNKANWTVRIICIIYKLMRNLVCTHMHQELARSGRNLADISLAPKLLAVRQLLWDCGIGRSDEDDEAEDPDASSRHRVLIFAQMKVLTLCMCINDCERAWNEGYGCVLWVCVVSRSLFHVYSEPSIQAVHDLCRVCLLHGIFSFFIFSCLCSYAFSPNSIRVQKNHGLDSSTPTFCVALAVYAGHHRAGPVFCSHAFGIFFEDGWKHADEQTLWNPASVSSKKPVHAYTLRATDHIRTFLHLSRLNVVYLRDKLQHIPTYMKNESRTWVIIAIFADFLSGSPLSIQAQRRVRDILYRPEILMGKGGTEMSTWAHE